MFFSCNVFLKYCHRCNSGPLGAFLLFIVNKISAPFLPLQAQRNFCFHKCLPLLLYNVKVESAISTSLNGQYTSHLLVLEGLISNFFA